MAKKNKEKYVQEMEIYKQKKEEESVNLKREDEELMKVQKHSALQLLKKKEKTENIIKVLLLISINPSTLIRCLWNTMQANWVIYIVQKTKENRQKKKKQKEEKNGDPHKPKKPASSFFLFRLASLHNKIIIIRLN